MNFPTSKTSIPSKVDEVRAKMAAIKAEIEQIFTVMAVTPADFPIDWMALECLTDAAQNLGSFLALTQSKDKGEPE